MTPRRDAELSALLDGALDARAEASLRAELLRDPALAARLAELASVDDALRALPARPVPSDLRARLQTRLDAEARRPRLVSLGGGARASFGRRLAGAGLAAAAALAALLLLPPFFASSGKPPERVAGSPPPEPLTPAPAIPAAVAPPATPAPQHAERSEAPASSSAEPAAIAATTPPAPESETAPDLFAPEPEETVALSASEEAELAALGDDADVVSVLDLLSQLDELEAGAS